MWSTSTGSGAHLQGGMRKSNAKQIVILEIWITPWKSGSSKFDLNWKASCTQFWSKFVSNHSNETKSAKSPMNSVLKPFNPQISYLCLIPHNSSKLHWDVTGHSWDMMVMNLNMTCNCLWPLTFDLRNLINSLFTPSPGAGVVSLSTQLARHPLPEKASKGPFSSL